MNTNDRIRIQTVETLSDDWYILKKTTFDYKRANGTWQRMSRETYDRGNGAVILLYNKAHKTVILTQQFRYPAYANGYDGLMIEACAGLLDQLDPETAIKKETEEETGYQIGTVTKIFEAFMSPGSVTEKLFFFIAEYDPVSRANAGGGLESDGEDITVLEIDFDKAMRMVADGEIVDGKTIMLLQYAQINHLVG